jgi:hypothetical protein
MVDPVTGGPHTAHTTNPVPMIYVAKTRRTIAAQRRLAARHLAHAAELLKLGLPKEMTGGDLRVRRSSISRARSAAMPPRYDGTGVAVSTSKGDHREAKPGNAG